jgi:GNAT superfamily N-acetyltransferase
MELRQAGRADLDTVVLLWHQLAREMEQYEPYYRLADDAAEQAVPYFAGLIGQDDSLVLLASAGGRTIGIAAAVVAKRSLPIYLPCPSCVLTDIYVEPGHRRAGVGTALVTACREWCRERGARILTLSVLAPNPARLWYERLGFKPHRCSLGLLL